MDEASRKPWRNLQICRVKDAGTIWVREVPSQTSSEELLKFLEMEKQINHHFKNKFPQDYQHASTIQIGNPVVVCYEGCCARGKVEKMTDRKKISVFLLDYGPIIEADLMGIIPLNHDEWTSVPYQARKISLFGVTPVSLQYTMLNQEIKIAYKQSKQWDPSATEYVRLLSLKKPRVEFTPVVFCQDDCLYGKLMMSLPKETWAPIIPESSKNNWVQGEDNDMAVDLAQLLVNSEFAEMCKENELNSLPCKKRCSGDYLSSQCQDTSGVPFDTCIQKCMNKSSVESPVVLSTTAVRKTAGLEVSHDPPVSQCTKARSSVMEETTYSYLNSERNAEKQAGVAGIEGIQKNGMKLQFPSYSSDSNVRGLYTRSGNEERLKLTHWSNLSSTNVTSPLFRGLSSEHVALARNKIFSLFRSKPDFHSTTLCTGDLKTISKSEENMMILKDESESIIHKVTNEEVDQNGCFKTFMTDLSIEEEKDSDAKDLGIDEEEENSNAEETVEGMDMNAAPSLRAMPEGCINLRESLKNTKKYSWSNIPQWVCTSLVGAVNDHELSVQKQECIPRGDDTLSERDCLEKNEKAKIFTKIDYLDHRTYMERKKPASCKEKKKLEKSDSKNASTCIEKVHHASNMSDFQDLSVSNCIPSLEKGIYNIIKQDPPPSISNIIGTYRVFVAGEFPILEEEVMINKDIMSTTLNSHIVKVLCKNGMKATLLQAYTWQAIIRGCSAVIIGDKSCGKTMGYVVPLLSVILDTYQHISVRLPPGIGPLMVVVCSTWQSAKSVADYVTSLLPADTTLKMVTAWGGCGNEEEISIERQLLGGCDILLTTAPFLVRLLTGSPALRGGSSGEATTTLTRCCHLVVDEADIALEKFSSEIKHIMTEWGEERKKCARSDLEFQAVLVSCKWTKLLSQLTCVLLPLLDPTIIISAPCEAAIATKVESHIHCVSDETEAYCMVMNIIAASYSKKKNMIFVRSDSAADKMGLMMKNIAIYCLVVNSTIDMEKLQQLIHEWHFMHGVTMIVSENAEESLLYHDLADAQILFHTHLGSSWTTFSNRYGFMVDNFVTDVEQKSVDCESYIIVPKFSQKKIPKVWRELNRICDKTPEMKADLSTQDGRQSDDSVLCHYLKAYGSCFDESTCKYRHEVYFSDKSQYIPKTGRVTVEVITVLNASRYLVRLTEYQEKSGGQRIDLSNHYQILKSALQQHYADSVQHEPLGHVEKGTLCAVEDSGLWTRAQVVSVDYSHATCLLTVFLIDEGKEVTLNLYSARILPPCLANFPQLIVEVFLCCIQPFDQDSEWTVQASNFMCKVFAKNKKSRFVGTIVLALGHTLWLNPVVEFSKIGKEYIQKRSLRGKLLSEGFGMDNPIHIKNLEEICTLAGVPPSCEDVCTQGWIETLCEALQKINIADYNENLSTDTLTDCELKVNLDETIHKVQSINDDNHSGNGGGNNLPTDKDTLFSQVETGKVHIPVFSPENSLTTIILDQEQLPLHTEIRVELAELVSPEEFFILREDRLQELGVLEAQINNLCGYLEFCEGERNSYHHACDKSPEPKISSAAPYIAKFMDKKYYRGQVRAGEPDGTMLVFFVDHGETMKVPGWQVHACPDAWVEFMPGQAIRCTLAYVIIPPHQKEAATQAMLHLADIVDTWTLKAVKVRDDDGPVYVVELTALNPPMEMWKELVHQGLALMETEMLPSDGKGTSEFLNASNIDDQEIADFLLGISTVKQKKTKKPKKMATEVNLKHCHTTTTVESEPRDSASGSLQQNSVHISVDKGKESENSSNKIHNKKNISRSINSILRRNNESELCAFTVKHNEQNDGRIAQEEKICNLKGKDQDVNVAKTSGRNNFYIKDLRMPPLSAVEGVTKRLVPETTWSQKEETIHINIHLFGVEQYKCRVHSRRLIFMSVLGDKFYVLDEELSLEVTPDSCVVSILGIHVSVTLQKATRGKWISLFKERRHRPWLRRDYQNLSSGDSSETENNDDDGWTGFVINKELPRGGLPAGISDTDGSSDTDVSENSDETEKI